jgi:hypothetical protein
MTDNPHRVVHYKVPKITLKSLAKLFLVEHGIREGINSLGPKE